MRAVTRLAASLLAAVALLCGAAAASASASVDAFVGCSTEATAKPAHVCRRGAEVGAFFTSTTGVHYDVCLTTPEGKTFCARDQQARANTKYVNQITTAHLGEYGVVWTASEGGEELASWSFRLEQGASLTPASASAGFKDLISEEEPGAVFPPAAGKPCPVVYRRGAGESSATCFAEFRVGRTWHLDSAAAKIEGGELRFLYRRHTQWRRKWRRCPLHHGTPGKLVANNGCGKGTINDDAYLVEAELVSNIREGHPLRPLAWQFTFSEGFNGIGVYHGRHRGRSYVFTNRVGDSFRYTP
jgi:hypothetical protein